MGIIDSFKQWRKDPQKYQQNKYADEQRKEADKRTRKAQAEQDRKAAEDRKYQLREREAKRRAEELRIREQETVNREKEKELKKRNLKSGPLGGIMDTGRRIAKNYDNIEHPRRHKTRRQHYNNYSYRPSYQSAPRRKGLDDIDREFDKFF